MEGIYASLKTSKGSILLKLTYKETPGTVGNFVSLAEGTKKNTHKNLGEPYYDGIKFHRVIPNFMVQGGCPQGSGSGGPGYKFDDEFHQDLKHDRAGTLSMANAGPGTNGSQFFITHGPTDWLDGKHTVFGYVEEGQDVVNKIVQGDVSESIAIEYHGGDADSWDAETAFNEFNANGEALLKAANEKAEKAIESLTAGMKKTESGLFYIINKQGSGSTPSNGSKVSVHYKGSLVDGTVFDSSYQRDEPIEFSVGIGQVIKGWDEGIMLLSKGSSARFVIPSHLGYGVQGAGGAIPPNSTLIFDVELIDF